MQKFLLGVKDESQQHLLARRIIESNLSVRESEKIVKRLNEGSESAAGIKSANDISGNTNTKRAENTAIADLEKRIEKHFNTNVSIQHGKKKGKLVIEYFGNEDLDRLLELLGLIKARRRSYPMSKKYWLMKSEPDAFSFQDLKDRPKQREPWDGVRNYQARNFMRDDMSVGDGILFIIQTLKPPGIVGLAEVASKPYPLIQRLLIRNLNIMTKKVTRIILDGFWLILFIRKSLSVKFALKQ